MSFASTFTDFFAGLCAGWAQVLVGQPLDLIKTHFQMSQQNKTLSQIISKIKKQNGSGLQGFYKGASSMFIGTGLTLAYEFGLYQGIKQLFRVYVNKSNVELIPIYQIAISGGTVGFMGSLIYTPTEFCKIQMQTNVSKYNRFSGASQILIFHLKKLNLTPIFKGFSSCVLREVIGTSIYFSVYEMIIRYYLNQGQISHTQSNNLHILFAGACSGIFYWLPIYPIDNIKTQIQSGIASSNYEAAKVLIYNKTLFRGLHIALMRSIPINAASFVVFQNIQRMLRKIELKF